MGFKFSSSSANDNLLPALNSIDDIEFNRVYGVDFCVPFVFHSYIVGDSESKFHGMFSPFNETSVGGILIKIF